MIPIQACTRCGRPPEWSLHAMRGTFFRRRTVYIGGHEFVAPGPREPLIPSSGWLGALGLLVLIAGGFTVGFVGMFWVRHFL